MTCENPQPQGVSKGGMVEAILTEAARSGRAPDWVLCIGDDRSDEDMFGAMENVTFSPHLPAQASPFCHWHRSYHSVPILQTASALQHVRCPSFFQRVWFL